MRRRLPLAAAAAVITALSIFFLDAALAPPINYMGVSDPSVTKVLMDRYFFKFAGTEGRIFLLYLALGLAAVLPGVFWPARPGRRGARLWLFVFPAVTVFCLMMSAICRRPNLFEDSWGRSIVTDKIFLLAATHGSPWWYMAPLISITAVWAVLWIRRGRRKFLMAMAVIGLLASAGYLQGVARPMGRTGLSKSEELPPVIFIGVDSLRSDILEEKIEGKPLLPNLERLRQRAVYFPRTFVPLARTFPSLVSLLTSTPPSVHGIRHMFPRLEGGAPPAASLAEVLGRAGYRTGVFADYAGDIFSRIDLGFDHVDVPVFDVDNFLQSLCLGRHPAVMAMIDFPLVKVLLPGLRITDGYTEPLPVTEHALDFLSKEGTAGFVFLFYSSGHFPYAAPYPWYRSLTPGDYTGPYRFDVGSPISDTEPVAREDALQVGRLYRQGMLAVDDAIGRLRERLTKAGLWDKAVIVLFSDHGEHLGEDGLGYTHGDHLIGDRVQLTPLLISFPDGSGAGKTVERTVSLMDAAPAVLEYLGLPVPDVWAGIDLLPYVRSGRLPPERLFYAETGLWFDTSLKLPHGSGRMLYPSLTGLLEFDGRGNIVIKKEWEDAVEAAKHRCVAVGNRKLIYVPARGKACFFEEIRGSTGKGEKTAVTDGEDSPLIKKLTVLMREDGYVKRNPYFVKISGGT